MSRGHATARRLMGDVNSKIGISHIEIRATAVGITVLLTLEGLKEEDGTRKM